jgi:hypothetical protein
VARRSLIRRNRAARTAADPQPIAARLEHAIAGSLAPDGAPMQFIGVVHTRESYAKWRQQQRPDLRATTPPLQPGSWALLLWAMRPSGVRAFVQGRPRDLYTAPVVGMPPPTVSYQTALAHSIAGFLELNPGGYQFAPPILVTSQTPRLRMHLEPLERTWQLPANEALGVRR